MTITIKNNGKDKVIFLTGFETDEEKVLENKVQGLSKNNFSKLVANDIQGTI